MKVAFYGSTNFSLSILKKLKDFHNSNKIELAYVVSQSTKQLQFSKKSVENPVVEFCKKESIKLFTPNKLKDPKFLERLSGLEIDLAIVAAYGKILPISLIQKSKYGFINFHGSLLPKYRGAVPVQFTILNQDLHSAGISIIKMDKGMDDGDILKKVAIKTNAGFFQNMTAGDLMSKLSELSSETIENDFDYIFSPELWELENQNESDATYCYVSDMNKDKMEILSVDGFKTAHGKIMASNPEPKAWLNIESKKYNLIRSKFTVFESEKPLLSGKLRLVNFNKTLLLELSDGFIEILEIQPEGKKVMDAKSFINGYLNH